MCMVHAHDHAFSGTTQKSKLAKMLTKNLRRKYNQKLMIEQKQKLQLPVMSYRQKFLRKLFPNLRFFPKTAMSFMDHA